MITVSKSVAEYVFDDLPERGHAKEVAPGVYWLRMPLPFQLNHINLWLLEDGDGWTIVDTGFANDEVKACWEDVFDNVFGGKPVKKIVVTHFHPDHLGLAGWLQERFNAPLLITLGEFAFGRMLSLDDGLGPRLKIFTDFYGKAGFDDELMNFVSTRGNPYPKRVVPIPGSYHRLRDGETFDVSGHDWKVIVGTGHSPEHACLYCEDLNVLISGDQILPRISPNVSVWPQEPESNPLQLFLDSLERFGDLPEDVLVLPSHDTPFRNLHGRLNQLAHHHDARLEETFDACAEPATAAQVLKSLFTRELDSHQVFFAIGESLAHLHYLKGLGRIKRTLGDDGVYRFSQSA